MERHTFAHEVTHAVFTKYFKSQMLSTMHALFDSWLRSLSQKYICIIYNILLHMTGRAIIYEGIFGSRMAVLARAVMDNREAKNRIFPRIARSYKECSNRFIV